MFEGLSEKEVQEKRKIFGYNIIGKEERVKKLTLFLSQFQNPLIYILLAVGFLSFLFKEYFDLFLILAVVILNVLMGFFQEYNAQKTLFALRKILKPLSMVIREGKKKNIKNEELVPGDLVVLIAGDRVGADGKLIQGEILVSEAILTGEEEGILKKEGDKVFMGTTVLAGKGIMEVEKIGKETEMGKIGKTLSEIKEEKTPLQIKLEEFSKKLAVVILVICFFIFLSQVLRDGNFFSAIKISTVLAIAAIPEALPIVVTVILALGMKRISKKQGLIKSLLATEILGSTSVICLDKTGTITEGKMRVVKTAFVEKEGVLLTMLLNNEEKTGLEIALLNFAREELKEKADEILKKGNEVWEEPFDSEKKYSMSIWEISGKKTAFLMGAPEIILNFCQIEEKEKEKFSKIFEDWAEEGLRVLGFAKKEKGNLKEKKEFQFLGLAGIMDPIRKEVKELIKIAQKASIKVKIVTGDYRKTAERVARILGFDIKPENIMEGEELEKISEEELKERIDDILIFARVLPHQKRKIVDCLQKKGEVVAMTGDGVNDALALKEADIGIAVGESTEVAKEAADLVLLDSNFKTIIETCEEGRLILSNIKKSISYILSNSFLEIAILSIAGFLKIPPPINVLQILWLHLICDGPPDLMFAFEPKEKDLMERKPIDIKKEPILDNFLFSLIATISVFVTIFSLVLYWYFGLKKRDHLLGSTIVFATLGSVDLIYALSFKNLKKPIIKMENFFENKFLFLGIFYGFFLLALALYFPPLNKILKTTPLNFGQVLLVFAIGLITTLILEMVKILTHFLEKK